MLSVSACKYSEKSFRRGNSEGAVVKDGQKRGTVGGSVKLYFSLDDILKWIFSKEERNKRRNRKRDDTWRYYNAMP